MDQVLLWGGFLLFVAAMLARDLGVGSRSAALPARVPDRLRHNGLLTHNYLGNGVLLTMGV
jgi:hypothetical protein